MLEAGPVGDGVHVNGGRHHFPGSGWTGFLSLYFFFCQPSVHYDCISCVTTWPHAGSGLVDQRVPLVIALLGEVQSCNRGLARDWHAGLFVLDKTQVSAISCEKI